jgi:predicted nuclease with TOPRIM domain
VERLEREKLDVERQLQSLTQQSQQQIQQLTAEKEDSARQLTALQQRFHTSQQQLAQTNATLQKQLQTSQQREQEANRRIAELEAQLQSLPSSSSSGSTKPQSESGEGGEGMATHWMYPREQIEIAEPAIRKRRSVGSRSTGSSVGRVVAGHRAGIPSWPGESRSEVGMNSEGKTCFFPFLDEFSPSLLLPS